MTDSGPSAQTSNEMVTAQALPVRPELATVYRTELRYLWRVLWRLGVAERDLEDAAHDVFVVVHRKLNDYDPLRPLRPWLYGIAFRVALDRRRRAHVRREVSDGQHEGADERVGLDPASRAQHAQERALVQRALASLDDDKRAIFVLHELEGLAVPACVEILDAPLNTLYSRLRLAREQVTRVIREGALRGAGPGRGA